MIFTGYYAKYKQYKDLGLEPVAISGVRPDFYEGLYYPNFAPRWSTFARWRTGIITNDGYTKEYISRLNTLDKEEIKKDFSEYISDNKHCILLCYEKPYDFCHRHILAEWLGKLLNTDIQEYYVK